MTTKAPETISVDPWDFFLEDDLATEHVERFREQEWPQMLKELKHDYSYSIGEGQEPHWVTPGTAVLYHEVINISYGKEENTGWHPTNPLPIGNAVQLLNYLKKGFRLRASVEPQVNVESSETAEYTEGDLYANAPYVVPGKKAPRKFITWDAYRSYCDTRGISLRYDPPQEILGKMKEYEFYCLVHDHGFNSKRAAKNHRAYYVAPPPRGRGQKHATLEQMEVIQPKAKTSKTTKKTSSKATEEGLK